MINERSIAAVLRGIRKEHGGRPALTIEFADSRVDWSSLGVCTNHGLPALDQGQTGDCRWSLGGGESLHAHWYPAQGRVRFHLDRRDPVHHPIGHLLRDTYIPHTTVVGGILGAATIGFWGAIAGVTLGVLAGRAIPPRPTSVWRLGAYYGTGSWRAERIDRVHRLARRRVA